MRWVPLLALVVWSTAAQASRVIAVSTDQRILGVTHGLRPWEVGEQLCVIANEEEIACGPVARVDGNIATLSVRTRSAKIRIGMIVSLANSAIQSSYYRPTADPLDWFDFRNITLGAMTRSPTGHFQQAFADGWSIGFMPQYLNASLGNVETFGVGALGTMSFYLTRLYQGFFLTGAAGVYLIYGESIGVKDQTITPSLILVAGYRHAFFNNVNFSFALGAQYFHQLDLNEISSFNFAGYRPLFYFDWGFAF